MDTIGIRSVIDASVHRGLRLGTIDVKGAFLQAPRRSVAQRPTVCEPPNILRQMQLVGPQEKWLVHKALYGFVESPSDWAQFRDDSMRSMRWVQNGQTLCLCQTNERHIWKIHPEADLSVDYGYLAVYVDDILFGVEEEHLSGLVEALQAMWTCSPPEFVNDTTDMRFCGFELRAVPGGGIRLGQSNYVKEIVKKRGISGKEQVPLPKIVDDEDEILEAAAVKAAQGVVGELTWLTTRSRPDIAYGVGILSRLVHKRPRYAVELSQHLLRYLHATADWALTYYPCGSGDLGQDEELAVQRSVQGLEIYADASFSLPHERFKSVTGVAVEHAGNLLAWESGAQPFISQSTAESEVIAYNTAYQAGESVGMLLEQLGFQTEKRLYGDSRAGIAVLAAETGPWRTRHLRLRAAKLRELVQNPASEWSVRHMSGTVLLADGFTKSLQGAAFFNFRSRLHMEEILAGGETYVVKKIYRNSEGGSYCGIAALLCLVAMVFVKAGVFNPAVVSLLIAAVAAGRLGRRPKKANEQRPQTMAIKTEDESHTEPQMMGWSGAASPLGGKGTAIFGDPLGIEGSFPGIRAFRVRQNTDVDAMAETDPVGQQPLPKRGANAAHRRGIDALGAMNEVTRGVARMTISTEVTVEIEEGQSRVAAGSGGYGQPQEEPARMTSSTTGDGPSGSRDTRAAELQLQGPWNNGIYELAPRGADRWILDHQAEGWLVRLHGPRGRSRPFHPIHRSCPVEAGRLTGRSHIAIFSTRSKRSFGR